MTKNTNKLSTLALRQKTRRPAPVISEAGNWIGFLPWRLTTGPHGQHQLTVNPLRLPPQEEPN